MAETTTSTLPEPDNEAADSYLREVLTGLTGNHNISIDDQVDSVLTGSGDWD